MSCCDETAADWSVTDQEKNRPLAARPTTRSGRWRDLLYVGSRCGTHDGKPLLRRTTECLPKAVRSRITSVDFGSALRRTDELADAVGL